MLSADLFDLVEEEPIEESAICFLNITIHDLHHIFVLEMWCRRKFRVTKLTFVLIRALNVETTVRCALFNLEATCLLFFAVRVGEMRVVTLNELSFTVSMLVCKWNDTLPKLDWFSIFGGKPLLLISSALHLNGRI